MEYEVLEYSVESEWDEYEVLDALEIPARDNEETF